MPFRETKLIFRDENLLLNFQSWKTGVTSKRELSMQIFSFILYNSYQSQYFLYALNVKLYSEKFKFKRKKLKI